ncbi:aminotransferase class I/II-fold pyridoxal phosphate-dependent enzyme [Streptomyces sp. GC420]|uniref:aminotransferase class I/II-fold pyridoxal phosphate-dependent enzyme n=1 Tax=Streptomyces sp. GC420 TaxID=2697568 RepID=UPI001414D373|nr:aminotransferase class I/II-fold pyridoxal phosphate-dependent enzyme [Streptomyces sp. GC420]NBM21052.1 aminotransferase class I/II-fold pyridoxal phosphate-dependent enzyme [Streptomyces sp. GC420]
MRRTAPEPHGSVRFAPPVPEQGLPVLPELAAVLAAAAGLHAEDPEGGGDEIRDASCGYWLRRGLPCETHDVLAAPGAQPLLLALAAAVGGDALVPRPCPAWWVPALRLLGRSVYHAPAPPECGGVPDPYALLETVRRVRAEGGAPRLLLLCPVDDPTATVAPPELVHEVCEAAVGEGLHIISDETWRDTVHRPHDTVLVSPAEMFPEHVTVVCDLSGAFLPSGWPAAVARLPAGRYGARADALDVLAALRAVVPTPVAAAAAYALREPPPVADRVAAAAALHAELAAAVHRTVLGAGGIARPPQAGRHLYADIAAPGISDSLELEDRLGARLGVPAPGGHRFGDELGGLRVRLSTGPLLGAAPEERLAALRSPTPLQLPHVQEELRALAVALDELRRTPPRTDENPGTDTGPARPGPGPPGPAEARESRDE